MWNDERQSAGIAYRFGGKMKEYRVIEADKKNAEEIMNDMAQNGWEVVDVTYWTKWDVCLLITFVRERRNDLYD